MYGVWVCHIFQMIFQPALGQTTEGAGMTFAAVTVLGVVGLSPGSVQAAQVGKEVQDGAKVFVAGAPEVNAVDLTGLEADGCGAGIELEGLGVGKEAPVGTDFAQQTGRELAARTGE